MKYIDADRLKAEIKHLKIDVYDEANQFDIGARSSLTFLESFIDSFQQEQPECGCSEKPNNLPSNIDEAADDYGHGIFLDGDCSCIGVTDAFKAGANWRDAQIPKLPDSLNEAAEEYIKFKPRYDIQQELEEGEDPTEIECFTIDAAIDSFKAGAEWMAGRGIYADAEVCKLTEHAWVTPINEKQLQRDLYDNFIAGDEVIVQIRKKQ